jgi:hypothetical protein
VGHKIHPLPQHRLVLNCQEACSASLCSSLSAKQVRPGGLARALSVLQNPTVQARSVHARNAHGFMVPLRDFSCKTHSDATIGPVCGVVVWAKDSPANKQIGNKAAKRKIFCICASSAQSIVCFNTRCQSSRWRAFCFFTAGQSVRWAVIVGLIVGGPPHEFRRNSGQYEMDQYRLKVSAKRAFTCRRLASESKGLTNARRRLCAIKISVNQSQ